MDLSEKLSQLFERQGPSLMELAVEGDISGFERRLRRTSIRAEFQTALFLNQLIDNPGNFRYKDELVQLILDNYFDFENFFSDKAFKENDLWSLYAKAPTPDTQKMAAILLTEMVRLKILKTGKVYTVDFETLLKNDGSLKDSDRVRKIKESIIVTQNAVVDYVAQEGPTQAINRGAGFLNFMRDEMMADFWTRKFGEITEKSKYSLTKGDITGFKPEFV